MFRLEVSTKHESTTSSNLRANLSVDDLQYVYITQALYNNQLLQKQKKYFVVKKNFWNCASPVAIKFLQDIG